MKLAFLFSDAHHKLHLFSARVKQHKITAAELEDVARDVAAEMAPYELLSQLDFVGALRNGNLNGPVWYEGSDKPFLEDNTDGN